MPTRGQHPANFTPFRLFPSGIEATLACGRTTTDNAIDTRLRFRYTPTHKPKSKPDCKPEPDVNSLDRPTSSFLALMRLGPPDRFVRIPAVSLGP
ncbi:hypothetical protein CIB48_g12082 [Xylaria polymorpha]|nr:hypothetical protein CIB48_g12082 [Xylaria polymorpha]